MIVELCEKYLSEPNSQRKPPHRNFLDRNLVNNDFNYELILSFRRTRADIEKNNCLRGRFYKIVTLFDSGQY